MDLKAFKAYDIRGRVPDELNEEIVYRIGRAYADFLSPATVAVGRDIRLSSDSLCRALTKGLCDGGADVVDIGLCGTEEIYHATFSQGYDGGIMVTASHNPMDYNGMKLVQKGSRPISGDTGLNDIRAIAERGEFRTALRQGAVTSRSLKDEYTRHLLEYTDRSVLKPLPIVVNPGNGCAGPVIDILEQHLPYRFIRVNDQPDGTFPNGIPNPLLPENRDATARVVIESGAAAGIAWDGDFDRCFFFDEKGGFIEGYYIVGLLAQALLQRHQGARIIHDPRLTWNTIDCVSRTGGVPVMSKTGHAFIKERMRAEDAVYGGEMSAHHYFRDFAYCDSGMIPWLLVLEIMCTSGRSLSELVDEMMRNYPASGEINRTVADAGAVLDKVAAVYGGQAINCDHTDGLSMEFADWRLNLRSSNTEPLLRLNVESRGDQGLMQAKTSELLELIEHV